MGRERSDTDDGGLPAPIGGSQTSTTKALLVFIHIPKVYRVYISNEKDEKKAAEETEDDDGNDDQSKSSSSMSSRQTSFASNRNERPLISQESMDSYSKPPTESKIEEEDEEKDKDEESTGEQDIGYVEAKPSHKRTKTPLVEHIVTAEEMATIVKLVDVAAQEAEGEIKDKEKLAEKIAKEVTKPETESNPITSAMKAIFGVVTNKEDEVTFRLNREEAIRAMKEQASLSKLPAASSPRSQRGPKQPEPNTEIRVFALLQLTCKNLFNEGCFFTTPTITSITKGEEEDEWNQFTIMCKPISIGLVLERFERIGVGSSVGMISIYKSELLKTADWPGLQPDNKKTDQKDTRGRSKGKTEDGANLEAARVEWKNAASRLRIEQVKEQIHEQAELGFDFLALLVIASILAAIGLITNSTVVIVASMLVSPIMGPVMGMTFGSRVLDWSLSKSSLLNEIGALLIAVLVGLITGFASSFSPIADGWPTEEMASRGDITGLITGIAIAIPSGMGVALSILGNNTASLVGVAISASLLPPAVNAGVCWAHAILIRFDVISNEEDFATIGGISFALTVVNIVCIWVSGMIMFAIKEVAPSEHKSAFWARDIKVARAIQKRGSKKPKVDIETIREGLQDALERKRDERGDLGSRDQRLRLWRRRQKPADFSFSIADEPIDDAEEYLDYFMLGLNPIIEGAQALQVADRAAYLGFRSSLQDFAVEVDEPVPEEVPENDSGWFSYFKKS